MCFRFRDLGSESELDAPLDAAEAARCSGLRVEDGIISICPRHVEAQVITKIVPL